MGQLDYLVIPAASHRRRGEGAMQGQRSVVVTIGGITRLVRIETSGDKAVPVESNGIILLSAFAVGTEARMRAAD